MVQFEAEIEIEQSVIDAAMTDEFASEFFTMRRAEEVAEHLAWNMVRGNELSQLDGFADQPETAVKCGRLAPVAADELKPKPKKRSRRG